MSPNWLHLIPELNERFPGWTIVHNKYGMKFNWKTVEYEFYDYDNSVAFRIAVLCEAALMMETSK